MHKKVLTPQELVLNLEILRGKIARKPADYIPRNDYPRSLEDSFSRYVRTGHVNLILSLSDMLRIEFAWPYPFFVFSLSQSTNWLLTAALPLMTWFYVRVSLESLFPQAPEEPRSARVKTTIDTGMVILVRLSSRKLFRRWLSSKILADHHQELREIQKVYNKGYWYPCITAIFPLLDYICRKLLGTENLMRGIGQLNKMFSEAKISFESLRPGYGAWDYANGIGADPHETSNKDLRLVGVSLESFLQFAAIYYGHCDQDQGVSVLNRHAVLHGGRGRVWTKEDATRLLLFLDLMINLLPVFEVLLAPGP
jgi:hypothetical protein